MELAEAARLARELPAGEAPQLDGKSMGHASSMDEYPTEEESVAIRERSIYSVLRAGCTTDSIKVVGPFLRGNSWIIEVYGRAP